ncbi:MAG: ribosomal RNA small subunit methyltransferase A [Clostridiales bacterium]|nr:ribosomal RNA small subunit methyltransferase A [Clostridiales bacterium]
MKVSYQKARRRREDGLPFKHDLGQHFLYDTALLESLVASTGVTKQDKVLEIGPGSGMLTACLCEAAGQVLAVEVDESILPLLRTNLALYDNVSIIQGDIRRLPLPQLCAPLGQGFFVIANIPYNVTTPILDLLLESGLPIAQISVMVQKEVADKLLAGSSQEAYSLLSVKAQYYGQPSLAQVVPAHAFTPPPKVDSAFINLPLRKAPPYPVVDERLLFDLMRAGFAQRRKTLINAVKTVAGLESETLREVLISLGLSPTVRGEALSVEDWIRFANGCWERR